MKKIVSIIGIILTIFILSSCTTPIDNDKLNVVTTIFPVYDMARSIGRDKINLSLMVAPGQDIHSYDPSTDDIINAKKCDVLLYVGDNMESWIPDIINSKDTDKDQMVVELSHDERINLEALEHHKEFEDTHLHKHNVDMHIWTNPNYAIIMVENIKEALMEMDPENKDFYQENALEYTQSLKQIINEIYAIIQESKRRTLYFGSPFAFYYFTRAFNLGHETIYDTCSIEVEPTIDDIVKMNTMLKEKEVPVLYTKELLNDSIAKKVIEGTNAEICMLHSGHNVSIEDFNNGITFIQIWQNNIVALKKGLL
ncbi:MAG: zinc ABC transporter substrate-binding protein [Bacilli bacterium]|nr:zinc ABC transporter substrate-binding protein [Bacilli bacterium]